MGQAIAAALVLVISPFLLVSETFIKGFITSWTSGCLMVLEKEQVRPDRFLIRGYLSGKPPKELPLTFSASEGKTINRIHMINEVLTGNDSGSLGLHPQTSFACPGAFCEGQLGAAPKQSIVLTDLHEDFSYAFHVDLSEAAAPPNLKVFALFNSAAVDAVCRVEEASPFNYFMRLSKFARFLWLLAGFILATYIIAALRPKGDGK
ncbi:hypothetical protein BWI17_18255 [Betaproteobacteria bacterium GR16-43]|nr:hypothetical protein BWI17_18255 [Betaproteobacteria bacterium GR16-43]